MINLSLIASLALLPAFTMTTQLETSQSVAPDTKQTSTEMKPLEKPLTVDDQMIAFEIENALGGQHKLYELLESGPLVITFYRGSWCPYCRTELSSVQKQLSKISAAGAQVLAISPEIPSETADLAKQNDLGFLFGTDHDNELATKLALSFKLDAKTIQAYKGYGINLKKSNDSKVWELPIPATYVVDTDRTIRYAFVEEDYSKRADYKKIVKLLEKMNAEG